MAKKLSQDKVKKINQANAAAAEGGKRQREKLVIDFDAFHAEYQAEDNDIEITFEGEQYKLPSEPTGEVFTIMLRNLNDGTLSDEAGLQILGAALGDEFLQALSKSKAPIRLVMEKILNPVMKQWGFGDNPEYTEGNATTPE